MREKIEDLVRARGFVGAFVFLAPFLLSFLRGLCHGYPLVFVGRGVTIRFKKRVKIGKFSRIEPFVEIDGFGQFGVDIGQHCKIGKFSIVRVPPVPDESGQGVVIGDRSTLAEFCFIGGAGFVEIGSDCSIGQYVSMHPQNHLGPSKKSGTQELGIKVGNEVWIGAKATLLDGTVVDSNSIVGAAALLNKRYQSGTLIGIPAKNASV